MTSPKEKLKNIHSNVMDAMISSIEFIENKNYDQATIAHNKSNELSKQISLLLNEKGAYNFKTKTDDIIDLNFPTCAMYKIKIFMQQHSYNEALKCLKYHKTAGIEAADSLTSQDFIQEVDIMYHSDSSTLRPGSVVINLDEF